MRLPEFLRCWLIRNLPAKLSLSRKPDFIIGPENYPYLRRWWVIPRNRFFNIYLHNILRSDDDRATHDHPWLSLSIILTGGYDEVLSDSVKVRREPGELIFRRPTTMHRIIVDGPRYAAWTLFLTGPIVRTWGFACPQGWRPWFEFVSPHNRGEVGPGCD